MREPPVGDAQRMDAGPGEFKPEAPFLSLLPVTRRVLFSPRRFFDELPPDAPAGAGLLYFLICYLIASAMIAVLTVLGVSAWVALGGFGGGPNPTLPVGLLVLALALLLASTVLAPVVFSAGVLTQHAIIVLVAGGAHRGLNATTRAFCYAIGATLLLSWVPFLGVVAAFYGSYLYLSGLRRVHGLPPARIVAAFSILAVPALAAAVVAAASVYAAGRQIAKEEPTSYYFPPPEAQQDLPPGVVGASALMDGNEDQERVRKMRNASYSDRPPPGAYHTEIDVLTADPKDKRSGVRGFARGSRGGVVRIDPENPTQGTEDTEDILYYTGEGEASSPPDYYEDRVVQPTLTQSFMLRGGGRYTVELEQVGGEPRTIVVNLYSDPKHQEGAAYFHVPYRVTKPGERLRVEVSPGTPLDELRLEADRDANGTYEESWMPEASVLGEASKDRVSPTTRSILHGSEGDDPSLALAASDRGSSDGETPASGVGITYYWINDSGPRIYTGPLRVESGDVVTYWSVDRAANVEWRRTVDIGRR